MTCFDTFTGAIIPVTSTETYPYLRWTNPGNETRFDGSNYKIRQLRAQNNYCFRVDGPDNYCFHQIFVDNETELNLGWNARYSGNNSASILSRGGFPNMSECRIFNPWDGMRPERREQPDQAFAFNGCYFTYVCDDAIENDWTWDGVINDCLFDGCYIFLSATGTGLDNSNGLVTVEDCVIRMMKRVGPDGHPETNPDGSYQVARCGRLLKYGSGSPPVRWRNVVILYEDICSTTSGVSSWVANAPNYMGFRVSQGQCESAENVTVIWPPEAEAEWGPFPGELPASGVTVISDVSVYTEARKNWLNAHTQTFRRPDDPVTVNLDAGGFPVIESINLGAPPPPLPDPTVAVLNRQQTQATIQFFFGGQSTTGRTDWGTVSGLLPNSKIETDYYTQHNMVISGLPVGTQIFFKVSGCNAAGACNESTEDSFWTLNADGTDPTPTSQPPYTWQATDANGDPVFLTSNG